MQHQFAKFKARTRSWYQVYEAKLFISCLLFFPFSTFLVILNGQWIGRIDIPLMLMVAQSIMQQQRPNYDKYVCAKCLKSFSDYKGFTHCIDSHKEETTNAKSDILNENSSTKG